MIGAVSSVTYASAVIISPRLVEHVQAERDRYRGCHGLQQLAYALF